MNRLLVILYSTIPKGLKLKLGQSQLLKGLRQRVLYTSNGFKLANVLIDRSYGNYKVNFNFVASIRIASKAKEVGIETTVLRHSFSLANRFFLGRNDLTVLDVGSNFGYLASVWADSIASKGKLFAFEPNKNLCDAIQKTIAANSKFTDNFRVFNLAVGPRKGIVTLNASAFSSNTEDMSTAIETYEVDMITLDSFVEDYQISNIDLIKIDVDGIELDILKGAENLLKQNKSIVIVETNDDTRIVDFFKALEYSILDMKLNPLDDSKALPLNIFCIPKTMKANAV